MNSTKIFVFRATVAKGVKKRDNDLPEYLQTCVKFQAVYFKSVMLDESLLQYKEIFYCKRDNAHLQSITLLQMMTNQKYFLLFIALKKSPKFETTP